MAYPNYPESTGGSGQWQTSDGNKYDSMGEAAIQQANIDSGKNMSFTNQQNTPTYDDSAERIKKEQEFNQWQAKMSKLNEERLKSGFALIDHFNELIEDHRLESYKRRESGDWDGAIREMKYFIQNIKNPRFISEVEKTIEAFADNPQTYKQMKEYWEALLADELLYYSEISLNYTNRAEQKAQTEDNIGAINDFRLAVLEHPFNDQIRDGLIKWLAKQYYILALKLGNKDHNAFSEDIIFNINAAHLLDPSLLDNNGRKRLNDAYTAIAGQLMPQKKWRDLFFVFHKMKIVDNSLDKVLSDNINNLEQADSSLAKITKDELNRQIITAGLPPQRAAELNQIVDDILVNHPAASLPRTDAMKRQSKNEAFLKVHSGG